MYKFILKNIDGSIRYTGKSKYTVSQAQRIGFSLAKRIKHIGGVDIISA